MAQPRNLKSAVFNRPSRGFSFVEMMVLFLTLALLMGLLGGFLFRNARVSRATDVKLQAIAALHDLSSRLRRDIKSAVSVQILDSGRGVALTNHEGVVRTYRWFPEDRSLMVPAITDPGRQVIYNLARIRKAHFSRDSGGRAIRFALSAIPFHHEKDLLTRDRKHGAALAGRVLIPARVQALQYPFARR